MAGERPGRDYWQAFRDHAARLLPSGTFGRLHRLARATAGGRAPKRKGNPEAAPGDPADPSVSGEPEDGQAATQQATEGATSDPRQPSVGGDAGDPYPTATHKESPGGGQVHVPGVSGMVDPRFHMGMPGPGGIAGRGGRSRGTAMSVAYALRKQAGKGGSAVEVVVKRAYDAPGRDGVRVLVDRRWPRGLSERWARIALVHKALAPSEALEAWAAANPWDREGFVARYGAELEQRPEARVAVEKLANLASRTKVTLVTAAPDREWNHALLLKGALVGDDEPASASLDSPADADPGQDDFDAAVRKAKWTEAYINSLPDSSFAYVAPGGKKDAEGRTFPRTLRFLPYCDHDGDDDADHIRNALQQLPKTDIPAAAKADARRKIEAAARRAGIEVAKDEPKKPPHVGLSDEVKRNFIEMAHKDPPIHIAAAMRRLSEWAASGHYPQGLDHSDLRWMHAQYAKILRHRNPDSTAGSTAFPTEKAYDEAVQKCHSLTATLGRIREIIATGKSAGSPVQKADGGVRFVPIVKADDSKRLIYGVVMEPNTVDTQGDWERPEEIEAACHRFAKNGRNVGLQHKGVTKDATVVENYIAPQDLTYTAPDGSQHSVKKGSWVQVTHVPDDDLWADVKEGRYTGYSVGGVGERVAA